MIRSSRYLARALALVLACCAALVVFPDLVGAQSPAVTSPRIGTLYQGAVTATGWGITAFAQHADGSLTVVGSGYTQGLTPEGSAVIHLTSGKALYVLAGQPGSSNYLFPFHIGKGGRLTPFTSPVAINVGPSALKLVAFDPLATGAAGTPLLATGACATLLSDPTYCGAGIGTFAVDPTTGILGAEQVGIVQSSDPTRLEGGPEMNASGQMAFTVQLRPNVGGWSDEMFFQRVKVVSGVSTLGALTGRVFTYLTSGTVNQIQLVGEPIVTSAHWVQIKAGNVPGAPGGWLSVSFGSASAAAVTVPDGATGGPTGSTNVESQAFVLAGGTTSSTGVCRFNEFGKSSPGLGATYVRVPCAGSFPSVTAAIDLHGFIYVGRYGQPTLLYRDLGTGGISKLANTLIPAGTIQAYSFSGF